MVQRRKSAANYGKCPRGREPGVTASSEELGQLLLVGVPGPELDAETAARFRALQPGGYILFARNMTEPAALRRLIDDLRDLSKAEPIVTLDQEGGRVSRLRTIGSEPPSAQDLRDRGDASLIARHGALTGRLLRLYGFNLNLCPVLDVSFDDDADNSLKGRCYGRTPAEVIANAGAFNTAMRREGVLSCAKHFPGYSAAGVDPHHALPVIERTLAELETTEFVAFRTLLPECDSVMVGHAWLPCFDPDRPNRPSSLSANVVNGHLRGNLGFDGLVMTDDLDMGAMLDGAGFDETVRGAILAGNDLAMICHRIEMAERARASLEALDDAVLERALARVAGLKRRFAPPAAFSLDAVAAIDTDIWRLRVATLGAERAEALSVEDGKRSPVETF